MDETNPSTNFFRMNVENSQYISDMRTRPDALQ